MAELFLANNRVKSVFQLLGRRENDMTYSLGWALSQSKSFLNKFLKAQLEYAGKPSPHIVVRLQQNESAEVVPLNEESKSSRDKSGGLTDIEIEDDSELFIILEAKVGATLVEWSQIEKYYDRKSFTESKAQFKRIVTLTENKDYAQQQWDNLHDEKRQEVHQRIRPFLKAISWEDVSTVALSAMKGASHEEKRLLRQFTTYLRYAMRTSDVKSNEVLVVLKRELPGTKIRTKEFIEKYQAYVHPFGQNWPRIPKNYIAFTDQGKLSGIHWVRSVKTMIHPETTFSELPPSKGQEFLVYELGESFVPSKDVRVGKIAWGKFTSCMLDTLFTSKTIADAHKESDLRRKSPA